LKKTIELLAPGGDIDSIKAAIAAGADAIYCGLDRFNARNRAENISFEDLYGILNLAHKNNCQVFLTLNIIILEHEIPAIIDLLNKLVNTNIDGIIVQDLGLLHIISTYFPSLKIHASTQLTTHNKGQIHFLNKFSVERVNLSRELNINEIKELTSFASENNILTEVFVHGSNCISFSGLCYISSVHGGNSGNRGRCSQPCRDQYLTTPAGKNYPLNLKDNSAFFDLKDLVEAGVSSLKIEGRIKKFDYIYTVVKTWKEQINRLNNNQKLSSDNSDLYKVFNRDFSNTFLKGDINKDMFIDNPRDNSIQHLSETNNYQTNEAKEKAELDFYKEKEEIKFRVEKEINKLSIDKNPLIINISGEYGKPLKVSIKSLEKSFVVSSEINLSKASTEELNKEIILKRLKALNETEYYIKDLNLEHLHNDLIIPFKELTSIKKRILFFLNDSKELIEPIQFPLVKKNTQLINPRLSVLISNRKDVNLSSDEECETYFQIPSSFKNRYSEFIDLFSNNKKLIPWFPSVIIGEDFNIAVKFLNELKPKCIVANNTGIAHEAFKLGFLWIAGPSLNLVNSYSLICLKEKLNCSGAFISNEINKIQIKQIKCPENFKLYYSIYHPIELMTSRQCFFHQITGCEKNKIDENCLTVCKKTSSITDLKKNRLFIEKSKGNYNNIYNQSNFLNTDIIKDLPNSFYSFFIDLSDIKTNTKVKSKSQLLKLFKNLVKGGPNSEDELKQSIYPTTFTQYKKGI